MKKNNSNTSIKFSAKLLLLVAVLWLGSCKELLNPRPIDLQTDAVSLNDAADVQPARVGMYSAFRNIGTTMVIAGDATADNLIHIGTFTEYRELTNKQITTANGQVSSLWAAVFRAVYLANFVLEKLPTVSGVRDTERKTVLAEARFLRGMANFIGANTFGGIPKVTTIDQLKNATITKATKQEILASVLEDFQAALTDVPAFSRNLNAGFINKNTVNAALARFHLYQKNYTQAEQSATAVIASNNYTLGLFSDVVTKDFPTESIFELGYTLNDDPGTLNDLFIGRRELIPSNNAINALRASLEAGDRRFTIAFDGTKQKGNDNGWGVQKYGTKDADNNNIVIFRLAEMFLIRAEARALQNRVSGANSAVTDLNVLRTRAKAPLVVGGSQAAVVELIEKERQYELAYEGHRWYDLVRTGRAQAVLGAFSPNWNSKYELWPIPLSEIQRNTSLANAQNPGY